MFLLLFCQLLNISDQLFELLRMKYLLALPLLFIQVSGHEHCIECWCHLLDIFHALMQCFRSRNQNSDQGYILEIVCRKYIVPGGQQTLVNLQFLAGDVRLRKFTLCGGARCWCKAFVVETSPLGVGQNLFHKVCGNQGDGAIQQGCIIVQHTIKTELLWIESVYLFSEGGGTRQVVGKHIRKESFPVIEII